MADFYQPLFDKIHAIPGVQSVGMIQVLPIQNWGWNSEVHVAGTPPAPPNEVTLAEYRVVLPGYFEVFQERLVRGRLLDPKIDTPTSKPVIFVNEAFVKKFVPEGRDPVGMQLDDDDKTQIVGVVRNVRQNIYEPPLPETDSIASQVPKAESLRVLGNMTLVIRTSVDPESIVSSLRRAFQRGRSHTALPHTGDDALGDCGHADLCAAGELALRRICRARCPAGDCGAVWADQPRGGAIDPRHRCAHGIGRDARADLERHLPPRGMDAGRRWGHRPASDDGGEKYITSVVAMHAEKDAGRIFALTAA